MEVPYPDEVANLELLCSLQHTTPDGMGTADYCAYYSKADDFYFICAGVYWGYAFGTNFKVSTIKNIDPCLFEQALAVVEEQKLLQLNEWQ